LGGVRPLTPGPSPLGGERGGGFGVLVEEFSEAGDDFGLVFGEVACFEWIGGIVVEFERG
jgi:hypothetical protein